jgi:hypothetical protein
MVYDFEFLACGGAIQFPILTAGPNTLFCQNIMKIFAIALLATVQCIFADGLVAKPEVEITLMAIGDPSGSKLQAGTTGCAVIHFKNHLEESVRFPTAPRSLGKGRVEDWDGASYISPKQGKEYGWGYRAAYDFPKVKIEFVGRDGAIAHVDSSIQLQRIDLINAGGWGHSLVVFSTPPNPGVYTVRLAFDNTNMLEESGRNNIDVVPADTPIPRVLTVNTTTEVEGVTVVTKPAEQAGTAQPAIRLESDSEGSDKPQPEAEGRSR